MVSENRESFSPAEFESRPVQPVARRCTDNVILATGDSSEYPGTPPSGTACVLHVKSSLLFAYSGHSPVARGVLPFMYWHVCNLQYQLSSWNAVTDTGNKIYRTETDKS
jgi:hypothetical protein